jgi:hypothetical protein
MVTDNYVLPQKTNGAVQQPDIEALVRQAVQEAVRQVLPPIQYNNGDVHIHITVHLHF